MDFLKSIFAPPPMVKRKNIQSKNSRNNSPTRSTSPSSSLSSSYRLKSSSLRPIISNKYKYANIAVNNINNRRKGIYVYTDNNNDPFLSSLDKINLNINLYTYDEKLIRLDNFLYNHFYFKDLTKNSRSNIYNDLSLKTYKSGELLTDITSYDNFYIVDCGTFIGSDNKLYTTGNTINDAALITESPSEYIVTSQIDNSRVWYLDGPGIRYCIKKVQTDSHKRRKKLLIDVDINEIPKRSINLSKFLMEDKTYFMEFKHDMDIISNFTTFSELNYWEVIFIVEEGMASVIDSKKNSLLTFTVGNAFRLMKPDSVSQDFDNAFTVQFPVFQNAKCLTPSTNLIFIDGNID